MLKFLSTMNITYLETVVNMLRNTNFNHYFNFNFESKTWKQINLKSKSKGKSPPPQGLCYINLISKIWLWHFHFKRIVIFKDFCNAFVKNFWYLITFKFLQFNFESFCLRILILIILLIVSCLCVLQYKYCHCYINQPGRMFEGSHLCYMYCCLWVSKTKNYIFLYIIGVL